MQGVREHVCRRCGEDGSRPTAYGSPSTSWIALRRAARMSVYASMTFSGGVTAYRRSTPTGVTDSVV
jgi:hypothetical protein